MNNDAVKALTNDYIRATLDNAAASKSPQPNMIIQAYSRCITNWGFRIKEVIEKNQ